MKNSRIIAIAIIIFFSFVVLKTQLYRNESQQNNKVQDVVSLIHQNKETKEKKVNEVETNMKKNTQKENKKKIKEKKDTPKIRKDQVESSKGKKTIRKTQSKNKTNKSKDSNTKSNPKKETKNKKIKTITKTLEYETEINYDSNLEDGVKKVIQKGSNGEIVSEITEHYSNDQLISKDEKIISSKQPVNERIVIGTKKIEKNPEQNNHNDSLEQEVFNLVNKARRAEGLQPLEWNHTLHTAARIRAKEIVSNFSHTRPNGQQWYSVAPNLALGENIAYGQSSAQHVHNSWMNSKGHKENILRNNFKSIGVGLYITESGQKYWVQIFG